MSININVNTMGTGILSDKKIKEKVEITFDFRPMAIIEKLGLRNPIYTKTSSGGHFGREHDKHGNFSWERINQEIIAKLRE